MRFLKIKKEEEENIKHLQMRFYKLKKEKKDITHLQDEA